MAGKERPHRRAPCPNGRWSRVYAKCTTTRREQLVRRVSQSSRRDPTKPKSTTTDDASDPRVKPEAHVQESPNEEASESDDQSGEIPDKPDDEDHEMEGETLPEPDTAQRRRAQAEERSAQKHKRTCS